MIEKLHLHIVQSVQCVGCSGSVLQYLFNGHLEHHSVHGPPPHHAQLSGQAFQIIYKCVIRDQYYGLGFYYHLNYVFFFFTNLIYTYQIPYRSHRGSIKSVPHKYLDFPHLLVFRLQYMNLKQIQWRQFKDGKANVFQLNWKSWYFPS